MASCALAVGVPAVSSPCAVSHGQDEHCWGTKGAAGAGALGQLPPASPAGMVPSLCHFFPSQPMFLGVTPHLYRVLEKSLFLEDPGLGFAGLLVPLAPSHPPAQERGSCPGEFGSGDCVGVQCWAAGAVQGIPLPPQRRWHLRCGGESRRWRPCRDPWQLGRVVAVFPRSAPGVIAQTGTWGNSHPSPGMVMSQEDSKTNGSLRSSAALQDFSSHQPLHQQRQHLSRSLSPALEKELSGSWGRCQN